MAPFSGEPTFKRQSPDTPISEIALRVLVEFPDMETHVIGTATVVCGNLAITAKHVLDDIFHRFGTVQVNQLSHEIRDYAVRLYQILPGPEYAIWNVITAWPSLETDIAILQLGLHSYTGNSPPSDWKVPRLKVCPPDIGSSIVGFGYHSSQVSVTPNQNGYHLDINDVPTSTTGTVAEVLPVGNPAGRFTFPCYRVDARFDAGMSGGPVIDSNGSICGIISGTYGDDGAGHISYAVTLWPMLRTLISANRRGNYPRDIDYPMIDLALGGQIFAEGLENLDPLQFPERNLPKKSGN